MTEHIYSYIDMHDNTSAVTLNMKSCRLVVWTFNETRCL